MKIFSEPRFNVDVLKVEVPVNMTYVEGFGEEIIYSKQEASALFIEQSQATDLPFIFLSAGVSAEGFQETLHFAKNAGSSFNGVLCGRATWADCVAPFANQGRQGRQAAKKWLAEQGRNNIEELNEVLIKTASPWQNKISR